MGPRAGTWLANHTGVLDNLRKDFWFGLRQLRNDPGFAAVAVLSLALGIGANTAIFQLVDAIRMRTLPVQKPEELVSIEFTRESSRAGWWSSRSAEVTYNHWRELSAQQQAFSGVIAWSATQFDLTTGGEKRFAEGLFVSGDFFRVLGVNPVLGRVFGAADDSAGCGRPGAVISHAFWSRNFGRDPDVLGRTVSLDGHALPIIGVTPAAFFGVEVGQRFDVAIPLCADALLAEDARSRLPVADAWWLSMMGRLKPGWTLEGADSHLQAVSPAIMRATLPPTYKPDLAKRYLGNKLVARSGATGVSGLRSEYEQPLWLLLATTALVLLIACANLANLLLARASNREREMSIRLAIGASRRRLVQQLLIESLLLAVAGAVLGGLLARVLSETLVGFISSGEDPLFVGLPLDWRVLAFTAALALATCVLFGLVPALRATQLTPAAALRSAGRGATAGRSRVTLRRALVVTQVAFSLVLLVGALLFVRSLRNLMTTDAGFDPQGVLTVALDFSRLPHQKERRPAIHDDLLRRLSGLPGVVSVAQIQFFPVSGSGWNNDIGPDGTTAAASGKEANFNRVGPGYLRTMRTRLLAGRDFNQYDTASSPKVAVVNELFARKFFGTAEAVGRTFHQEAQAGKPEPLFQIVGVMQNAKYRRLREEFMPVAFFPFSQEEEPEPSARFVLRVAGAPAPLMKAVSEAVAQVSSSIGIRFRMMSAQLEESLLRERLMATLSSAFAVLAVLLSMLGLYGVIAYMVARRRNEIGVRMALGADGGRVIRLVLRETLGLLAVGLLLGISLALLAGRAAASLLYGLPAADPVSLAAAVGLLAMIAFAASYGPARRAASVEPMTALREE